MSAPRWEPGKIYAKGAVVSPRTEANSSPAVLVNGGFDADATGWNLSAGGGSAISWVATHGFQSPGCIQFIGASGDLSDGQVECATDYDVIPGQRITVSAMFQLHYGPNGFGASLYCSWIDGAGNIISTYLPPESQVIRKKEGVGYRKQSVSFVAPAGAKKIRLKAYFDVTSAGAGSGRLDNVTWDYVPPAGTKGLVYKAVQNTPGASAATEPNWPTQNGVQVVDGAVTWEAMLASYVAWKAVPVMVSGEYPPEWPSNVGESVADGSVVWECISRRVEDPKHPKSKVVAIMASKVFAADGDIVRFSATANPLDWSSPDDAGYLPTGLQQANAEDITVLQPYRGNLCAWNASSFQMWQVDPDPAAMALLDQMDGVGSTWTLAAQAVGNDLYYLSQLGVRSVNIANAAENLQAGDVGIPIDALVQEAIAGVQEGGGAPGFLSAYYPSAGQYWLAYNLFPESAGGS